MPESVMTLNLELGLPTVEEARRLLKAELEKCRNQKVVVVKVIHGYSCSGVGGALRQGIRKSLISRRKEGDRLSGLPNIKVISRTSAFHFKGRDIEPKKVAKELGVEALVIGRVVQRGDDLSVSAELVDAREDKQLWGEQYSRKLADITSVQQEIATAISGNLRVRLTSEDKTRLAKSSATNPEAYQLYLKGRYFASQATAAGLKKSIEYFEQAIDKDPGYALAYSQQS